MAEPAISLIPFARFQLIAKTGTAKLECWLRGEAFAGNNLHFITEAIEFAKGCVEVGRDAYALEFFVHDRHGEDVVFVEQVFRHRIRIGALDVNVSDCATIGSDRTKY